MDAPISFDDVLESFSGFRPEERRVVMSHLQPLAEGRCPRCGGALEMLGNLDGNCYPCNGHWRFRQTGPESYELDYNLIVMPVFAF